MKKKLFGTMVAIAAMFAGYSAYDAQNENEFSGAVLANVEALAAVESDGSTLCTGTFHVCESQYDSFCNDMEQNCDTFSGTIIQEDC